MDNSSSVIFSVALRHSQQPRTHHRRKRERHQQRNKNGHRHGPAERVHILARVPVHKRDRQKDDHQRKRGSHHRKSDFASGFDSRTSPVLALLFHEPKNIFQNDDGVIDHNSDRKRQRQQRHVIQRKIHTAHQRERRNDRRRNRHRRDQDRPP